MIGVFHCTAQSAKLLEVRGPSRVEVGVIWPMSLTWQKAMATGEMQLRIDAPQWFTLLAAPSRMEEHQGATTAWMTADEFTPPGRYTIIAELVHPGALQPPLRGEWTLEIGARPRINCALLEEGVDSTRYWMYNAGNEKIEHDGITIRPGEGKRRTIAVPKDNVLSIVARAGEWDTIVDIALKPFLDWEWTEKSDSSEGWSMDGYASQNFMDWKRIQPQYGLTMRGQNWLFRGDRLASRSLGSLTYDNSNTRISVGYGWGKAVPFALPELAPFVEGQTEFSKVKIRARWSTSSQNTSCSFESKPNKTTRYGGSLTVYKDRSSSGIAGQFFYQNQPLEIHTALQPGLAQANLRIRIPHLTLTARGAKTTPHAERFLAFRSHVSSTAAMDFGRWTLYHQFAHFERPNGSWAQHSSSWAAYRSRRFEARVMRHAYAVKTLSPNWQIRSTMRVGAVRFGVQALRSEGRWKAVPTSEYNGRNFMMRTSAKFDANGRVQFFQGQIRCKLGHGYHLFSTLEQQPNAWRYTTRLSKTFTHGQCAVILRSDASGTLSWQGTLHRKSTGKSLEGRCVDAQGKPIAGIEIMYKGHTFRTDTKGRFRWRNLSQNTISFQIQAASLPFAMVPDGAWTRRIDLMERTTSVELTFKRMRALRGQFIIDPNLLFAVPLDFTEHSIRLCYTSGETVIRPIRSDGSFRIGNLPSGEAAIDMVPPPKGYTFKQTIVVLSEEMDHPDLNISLAPIQESIPFELL